MHPLIASALISGPAVDLYDAIIADPPMSQRWLEEIRTLWGQPEHSSLSLFPSVQAQTIQLPSRDTNVMVDVQLMVPPQPTDQAVVYLHGGGWIAPMAGKHLGWAKRLACLSRRSVYAVHYRLAPEHPYPAALQDCLGVLNTVLQRHAGDVCIAGDSAGANLAAACDQWQRHHVERRPDRLLLICGVLDLQLERHRSMLELGVGHPYNGLELLALQRALYAPEQSLWDDPLASPAHGVLSDLPSTLVIVGEQDPLRDDGIDYVDRARQQGASLQLHVGIGMPHGFVMQHNFVPEAASAAEHQILSFLDREEH